MFALKSLSRRILLVFAVAAIGGALLHFLYDLFPNPVTALFSPMRESLWEHVKIVFWPFLAALLFLTRRGERGSRAPWLLSLLVICALMLAVAYWYHFILRGESTAFDIGLYVVVMALGFWLPHLFWRVAEKPAWGKVLWVLTALLAVAILILGPCPPDAPLFTDLSAIHTWFTIPF